MHAARTLLACLVLPSLLLGCESDVVGCANSGGAVDCESDRIGHARSARHGERGCETATDRVGPLLVPAACRAA